MRLVKFKIENYRSIKNSKECYLSNDITILAWKNESGKSTVLDALSEFNNSTDKLSEESEPIWWDEDTSGTRSVSCWFSLSNTDIEAILNEAWDDVMLASMKEYFEKNKNSFFVWKTNYSYAFYIDTMNAIQYPWNNKLQDIQKELSVFAKEHKIAIATFQPTTKTQLYSQWKTYINNIIQKWWLTSITSRSDFSEISVFIEDLKVRYKSITEECDSQTANIKKIIVWLIPEIVIYREFSRGLEYEMTMEQAKKNESFQDFCKISWIDLKVVEDMKTTQKKRTHLNTRSGEITGKFNDYWQQEAIILSASTNGENIIFSISEKWQEDYELRFEQRSEGFKWFFDFYLKMQASGINDDASIAKIILIDEPWLHLHAKALEDVLNVLKALSDKHQVIISTHSPYLIDAHCLERVRLVYRDITKWTYIDSINSWKSDLETITPILTAIGLSLDIGLTRKNTVITEWLSDYYYITAFARYLKKNTATTSFMPCVGVTNIPLLISLLYSFWNWEYKVVLDTDEAWITMHTTLSDAWIEWERLIRITSEDWLSIEDLFSKKDFNTFVLDEPAGWVKESSTIWNFLKTKWISKPLLAKKFNEFLKTKKKVEFDTDTVTNFTTLLEKLEFSVIE